MDDRVYRSEAQRQEDDLEYRRGVKAWEAGHQDGEAGKPNLTDGQGSYADHYASGYEEGAKVRAEVAK